MRSFFKRPPDFIIGPANDPYLLRWWIIPRNRIFNIYLHKFMRSDDDRALHDHPWWNCSILLKGSYIEHTPLGGDMQKTRGTFRKAPCIAFRTAKAAHRIQLRSDYLHPDFSFVDKFWGKRVPEKPVWTLFITGPKIRDWGFWCPQGWRRWQDFVAVRDGGNETGRGCE